MTVAKIAQKANSAALILAHLSTDKKNQALNERFYGDLQGLNKDECREKWGEEKVQMWRRSYEMGPPGGETLKETGERVVPYLSLIHI